MDYIPPQAWDQFYAPLVGSPAARARLRSHLIKAVAETPNDDDPYHYLGVGLDSAVEEAAYGIPDATIGTQEKIEVNSELGGILAIEALRTVGSLYSSRARVPQLPLAVGQSARRASDYIFGMAFSGGGTVGMYNITCASLGLDPRDPANRPTVREAMRQTPPRASPTVSEQTFRTREAEGQLTIWPRFQRAPGNGFVRCPATGARVAVEGGLRSGLRTLLGAVSEVTVEEIYPRYFPIAPPKNE
jgi:hypothetical protein